jgi:predicted P-loop ATPase
MTPLDYLIALPPHDGVPRLDGWLERHAGAATRHPGYLTAVSRAIFVQAVLRALYPGADALTGTAVLAGMPGTGKSNLLRALVLDEGWHAVADPRDHYVLLGDLQRNIDSWIVELTLDGRSRTLEDVKLLASRRSMRFRKACRFDVEEYPLGFTFIGTTNVDFNLEPSRRIWPVQVAGLRDLDGLLEARDQLWAEAIACAAHPFLDPYAAYLVAVER